jgi:GNAT superfamily N-acetyltransferase
MLVTVRPMDAAEAEAFLARSRAVFVEELAQSASLDHEQADQRARQIQEEFLPQGTATAAHAFLVIEDDGRPVGSLWLGPQDRRPDTGFIYDIVVDEAERNRGIGHAALAAAEDWARGVGYRALALNVLGSNPDAQRLYASVGYQVVATDMLKPLV